MRIGVNGSRRRTDHRPELGEERGRIGTMILAEISALTSLSSGKRKGVHCSSADRRGDPSRER